MISGRFRREVFFLKAKRSKNRRVCGSEAGAPEIPRAVFNVETTLIRQKFLLLFYKKEALALTFNA